MSVLIGLVQEQPRPDFQGDLARSTATGRLERQFPSFKRLIRILMSQGVIWTLVTISVS